jgi:hypothetical protein
MDGFDADVSEIAVELKSDNTSTITSFTGDTYKNPTTKKWSVSGVFMRGVTEGGVKGTATLVLKYPTGEEQDITAEYNFVNGLNFTSVYVEFTPIKIDLSGAESLFVELSKYYSAEREHGANRQSYEEKVATK